MLAQCFSSKPEVETIKHKKSRTRRLIGVSCFFYAYKYSMRRRLVVLGAQLTNYGSRTPHLAVAQSGKFLLQAYAIVGL